MNKALSECVSYASRCSKSYPTPYSKRGLYMIICDMHNDSIMRVTSESGLINECNMSARHPHLQIFSAFCPRMNERAEVRRRRLMNMFNIYLAECARLDIKSVYDCKSLSEVREGGGAYSMLAIEGGGGLFADSPELETLAAGGLCVLGMAWDTNELAASAWDKDDTGLSFLGKDFVRRCDSLGIISDVSHLSDKSFYELMEITPYPVLATHSNFRELANSPRNLTRDMASEIVRRGGVIGLNLYPGFLTDSGEAGLDDIVRHVDYALENFGDGALGFGFDIDGVEKYPKGISMERSIHDQVIELLLSRYSEQTVRKIAGENILNFLKDNL